MSAENIKGTNYDIYESFNPAADSMINQGYGGNIKVQPDAADVSDLEAGSTIKIGRIPAGATLLWGKIVTEALGTNVTFAVGDGTTADKFLAATSVAAAGIVELFPLYANTNLQVTVDTDIIITTAGATIASTKGIKTQIAYVLSQQT